MARVGISTAEVASAFEKLMKENREPTAENIHALLGKGTVTTIQRHIDELIERSRNDLLSPEWGLQAPIAPAVEIAVTPPVATTMNEASEIHEAAAPKLEIKVIPPQEQPVETKPRPTFQVKKNVGERQNNQQPNNHHNKNKNSKNHPQGHTQDLLADQDFDYEPVPEVSLESLSKEQLMIKIRRLESFLLKEQARRETAEHITLETKDYADHIKEQVAQRIHDLRQTMDVVVEQLKTDLREQKQAFAEDLKYYQEHLDRTNQKLIQLSGGSLANTKTAEERAQ
jgi:hypothetical protein